MTRRRRSHISQRTARQLRQRVAALEAVLRQQQNAWATEWVGGVDIGKADYLHVSLVSAITTARRLRHAVVVTMDENVVIFHALSQKGLPLP